LRTTFDYWTNETKCFMIMMIGFIISETAVNLAITLFCDVIPGSRVEYPERRGSRFLRTGI
jgi:hypothetical protein